MGSADRFAGRLTDSLADDNPVFIFHADHGEALAEPDSYGHQNVLYEEGIHIPLLIGDTAADSVMEQADRAIFAPLSSGFDSLAVRERWD